MQTSYASEALSVYQKHKNNSPTQTAKRWGKRKNSQNFLKKRERHPPFFNQINGNSI